MKSVLAAAALILSASTAHAEGAGLQIIDLFLPHHEASTRAAIWYPSSSAEGPSLYANNPVFEGVVAHREGPLTPGNYPLVLFSHGMGGTDRAQAWLGAALAEQGVISVLVNHPYTTLGNFDMSRGVAHWTRALDMSAALDALLANPDFADSIDPSRVMAAGFSYGGWTALSLGGARGNHAGIAEACRIFEEMEACDVLMSESVNMQDIDPALWNASYADPRVTHVAAIDPGFVWGLEQADVEGLVQSVLMIGFGAEGERMLATDFDQSGLASLLGDARIERLEPAYHFSAMPLCTAAGEAILQEDNDDPVCTDPSGSDRMTIHARIVDVMLEELGIFPDAQ